LLILCQEEWDRRRLAERASFKDEHEPEPAEVATGGENMPRIPRSFRRQSEIKKLDGQIRQQNRTVDLATAKQVMHAVTTDGRVSPEEDAVVGRLWVDTITGRLPSTQVGKALIDHLEAGVSYRAEHMRPPLWEALDLLTPGFPIKASYASTEMLEDKVLAGSKRSVLGEDKLRALVERYECAYSEPYGTGSARINPDVLAQFEQLQAQPLERLDENDPLAPIRAYLDANYSRR
jgi:hypothetical protein